MTFPRPGRVRISTGVRLDPKPVGKLGWFGCTQQPNSRTGWWWGKCLDWADPIILFMTGIPKIHQKKVEPDKAEACTCCFSQVVTSMCGTSLWTNYFNYFCKFQGKEYPTMFLLAMLGASCGHIICSKSNSKIILESHVGSQILIMFSRGTLW